MKEVILASASERRSRILADCGIAHKVIPSSVKEETHEKRHVSESVQLNAEAKAEKVAAANKGSIIIGADTLVVHGEDIIGKPGGEDAAREMLRKFSGSEIEVYTGLCVINPEGRPAGNGAGISNRTSRKAAGFEKSSLLVVPLSESRAERYFQLLAPYDKAGGFSIEGVGSMLFDNIRGSYFNILGLPMIKLGEVFSRAGLDILDHISKR